MDSANALGEFLRARRDAVRPEDVGIHAATTRRVPGLRREEVAMLAGISAEYYLRLERGRDQNPSTQVLQSLAQVLRLDEDSTAYLMDLARPKPRAKAPGRETVPVGVLLMVETLNMPAFIVNRYRDVLAANLLARALSPLSKPGVNRLVALFTDHEAQRVHPDWQQHAAGLVAQLRAEVGTDTDDPRFQALVGELSVKSALFRELWARHDVQRGGSDLGLIRNPHVGDLHLHREKLAVVGTDGLLLVVYHAEPGSSDADALQLLGSLAASTEIDTPRAASSSESAGPVARQHSGTRGRRPGRT